jgi:hypothetical protein
MEAAANASCPKCSNPMRLARVTPRFGGLPELRTFECRRCGVAVTEAVENPGLPNPSHRAD